MASARVTAAAGQLSANSRCYKISKIFAAGMPARPPRGARPFLPGYVKHLEILELAWPSMVVRPEMR
jgi:hypothetical protein